MASKYITGITFLNRARRKRKKKKTGPGEGKGNVKLVSKATAIYDVEESKLSGKVVRAFLHLSECPTDMWTQGRDTKCKGSLPISQICKEQVLLNIQSSSFLCSVP